MTVTAVCFKKEPGPGRELESELRKYFDTVVVFTFKFVKLTMTKRLNCGSLKAVLVDLRGTLHIENEVTNGAVEALERLSENST